MSLARAPRTTPRTREAIQELQRLILERYPAAQFNVVQSQDDPSVMHLVTTVDVDDTEEVVDLVIDRMMELQIDEQLPLYVIPIRPPNRVLVAMGGGSTEEPAETP